MPSNEKRGRRTCVFDGLRAPYAKAPVRLFMSDNWTLNRIRITEVPHIINALQLAGLHERSMLFEAVARGEIALLAADNRGRMPLEDLRHCRLPSITILTADGPGRSRPEDFDDIKRLLRWARLVIIHAQHATRADYRTILSMTQGCYRLLLVETTAALAARWRERLEASKKLPPFMFMADTKTALPETMH